MKAALSTVLFLGISACGSQGDPFQAFANDGARFAAAAQQFNSSVMDINSCPNGVESNVSIRTTASSQVGYNDGAINASALATAAKTAQC